MTHGNGSYPETRTIYLAPFPKQINIRVPHSIFPDEVLLFSLWKTFSANASLLYNKISQLSLGC